MVNFIIIHINIFFFFYSLLSSVASYAVNLKLQLFECSLVLATEKRLAGEMFLKLESFLLLVFLSVPVISNNMFSKKVYFLKDLNVVTNELE